MRRILRRCLGCAALLVLGGGAARANGRFPRADHIAFEPDDPQHLLVRTTFGLLESTDGGQRFSLVCEAALGLGFEENPPIVVTDDARRVAGRIDGLVWSRNGCDWYEAPELSGQTVTDLTLDRSAPGRVVAFGVRGVGADGFSSQVVRSDGGAAFAPVGLPLDPDLLPLSIDVAPGDSSRVYLSARLGAAGGYAGVLLRSIDGARSFEVLPIPETAGLRLAFIGAVDPVDADRLYVRVDDPDGTLVLASYDAGNTFQTLLRGASTLLGFALSPDGQSLALGGPDDGLWVGQPGAGSFERRADVAPTCLGWSTAGLYACADEGTSGFSMGRSSDQGFTFQPLVRFSELCGDVVCEGESQVGSLCGASWDVIAPQLGATCGKSGMPRLPVTPGPGIARPRGSDGLTPSGGCTLGGQSSSCPADRWGPLSWAALAACFARIAARKTHASRRADDQRKG